MSQQRPLYSVSPDSDVVVEMNSHRPWRLMFILLGLIFIFVRPEGDPLMVVWTKGFGVGFFLIGTIWGLVRVFTNPMRRRFRQPSALAKTVDELPLSPRSPRR